MKTEVKSKEKGFRCELKGGATATECKREFVFSTA